MSDNSCEFGNIVDEQESVFGKIKNYSQTLKNKKKIDFEITRLQIRGHTEDESNIIFLISQ